MLTDTEHFPATRIGPDDLLPDVGAGYRSESGRLYLLREMVGGMAYLWDRAGKPVVIPERTFWRRMIHMRARRDDP